MEAARQERRGKEMNVYKLEPKEEEKGRVLPVYVTLNQGAVRVTVNGYAVLEIEPSGYLYLFNSLPHNMGLNLDDQGRIIERLD